MQTLSPLKIVVVPAWTYRALLRNKLNNIELLNYQKIRSVLSLDDIAEWFYLNDRFNINKSKLSNTTIESMMSNLSPDAQREITNSVLTLSGSEEIASSANYKLATTKENIGNIVSNKTFQFIRIENILFVILCEGFAITLSDSSSKEEFIRDYLKECYAMASVSEVSSLDIFDLYLKQFAS
jgi:hypothetical protein